METEKRKKSRRHPSRCVYIIHAEDDNRALLSYIQDSINIEAFFFFFSLSLKKKKEIFFKG